MSALRAPTSSCNEGLSHIDWQIQTTSASRHSGTKIKQQSATLLLKPRKTLDKKDNIMFELTKLDVQSMLDKLAIIDQLTNQQE